MAKRDLNDMREEYTRTGLELKDLNPDPFVQFDHWFEQAMESGIPEPNAMSLATSGEDMQPTVRTVLLKYYDRNGLVFFTNYGSTKAKQINENSKVCLLFPWIPLHRQVIVRGEAEKISRKESIQYFLSRPHGSQLGAWVSAQSEVISNRSILELKLNEFKSKFKKGEVPIPDFWGGYRVRPTSFEFWQGRKNRLHDRFFYHPSDEEWTINRLSP